MLTENQNAWLALLAAPGIGARTARRLVEHCGSPHEVRESGAVALRALGLRAEAVSALLHPAPEWSARVEAWLAEPRTSLMTLDDADYPQRLAAIDDAPPLLYLRGERALLGEPQLAIVGTRNPSLDGRELTSVFAGALARAGLLITSGLALGIDAVAHEAALEHGKTIAVLGTGPDLIYPARHRPLARRVAEAGVLVSEFLPGTGPLAHNFPRRNRIISGLCLGVLVTEAAAKSGSLITARLALEQGRSVFAVPGSPRNPLSRGCHALIREGATLVEDADEVLLELAPQLRSELARAEPSGNVPPAPSAAELTALDPAAPALLDDMGFAPVAIDELAARSALPAERITALLVLLELHGHVSSVPGGRYCRTSPAT